MTSKCNKVKNPCKICLETVSNKTGIQCQGACKQWVHFACLNYTPGKIRDVKKGVIKVTCPCPDCKTGLSKEFRTDEPYSCTNIRCPSNLPRQCTNVSCPSNQKLNQTSDMGLSSSGSPLNSYPLGGPPGSGGHLPPLARCDKEACKAHQNPSFGPLSSSSSVLPTGLYLRPSPMQRPGSDHLAGDKRRGVMLPSVSIVDQICSTVADLTKQINDLMKEMKTLKQRYPINDDSNSQQPKKQGCDLKMEPKGKPKPCYCPQNPFR